MYHKYFNCETDRYANLIDTLLRQDIVDAIYDIFQAFGAAIHYPQSNKNIIDSLLKKLKNVININNNNVIGDVNIGDIINNFLSKG